MRLPSPALRGALPALALFASTALGQQGFNADTVRDFLSTRMLDVPRQSPVSLIDDLQMLQLAEDITLFRDAVILTHTMEDSRNLPQVMPGALDDFVGGEISSRFPFLWPYVIAGSVVVVGHSLGDDPIAALYNPYFDVALLTHWRFYDETETDSGAGFKLLKATPVTGRAFLAGRASKSGDQPVWTGSDAVFEEALVRATRTFVDTFEQRYPPFERSSASLPETGATSAVALVEERVFFLLKWVIDAQNPEAPVNYAHAINQVKTALASPFSSRLAALLPADNPQDAGFFMRLAQPVREGMLPYLVVGQNVLFIDPLNFATGFISVHFTQVENGYTPEVMALFSLSPVPDSN